MSEATDLLTVPASRRPGLTRVLEALGRSQRVVLSTHMNADGDGAGSECALAAWLVSQGKVATIVNPTPFPDLYRHLVGESSRIAEAGSPEATRAINEADTLVVVDTGEPARIGRVAPARVGREVVVIDHHLPSGPGFEGVVFQDPQASATGELVHDLLRLAGVPRPWPAAIAEGVYTAIVTDTGSFRFSNTTPRAHAIAGAMIEDGVDPEGVYRRIFATVPLRRIQLLRAALDQLEVDGTHPITWITVPHGVMESLSATPDDLEGLVEHARSIEGTEVALLFRPTSDGATKVSFRSTGTLDVQPIARRFGGGGHAKASGALVAEPLETVKNKVLAAVREALAGGQTTV